VSRILEVTCSVRILKRCRVYSTYLYEVPT
jgi:hypothetical protein